MPSARGRSARERWGWLVCRAPESGELGGLYADGSMPGAECAAPESAGTACMPTARCRAPNALRQRARGRLVCRRLVCRAPKAECRTPSAVCAAPGGAGTACMPTARCRAPNALRQRARGRRVCRRLDAGRRMRCARERGDGLYADGLYAERQRARGVRWLVCRGAQGF
jgi:hypothetical protein